MRVLLLLFFAFSVHAQSFQYRLEGSFATTATADPTSPAIVNYTVNWNETSTTIQGIYQDNYFSQSLPRTLTGTVSPDGRSMIVVLPDTENDVRQITLATTGNTTVTGSVSVSINTKNNIGSLIDSPTSVALLTALPAASEGAGIADDQECVIGFGALTGMCGIYDGTFNEFRDTSERCNILAQGNPRLQFGSNTTFSLLLNYIEGSTTPTTGSHTIGSFQPSPTSNTINISGRNCGNLVGTTFPTGNCKTLNLSGTFRPDATTNYGFTGTYQIIDEVTGDSCEYSMNLTRESQ